MLLQKYIQHYSEEMLIQFSVLVKMLNFKLRY